LKHGVKGCNHFFNQFFIYWLRWLWWPYKN